MRLTDELIGFCRESLGVLDRVIADSETKGRDHSQEEWLFHRRAEDLRCRWHHRSLNGRLELLGIVPVPRDFRVLTPFTELEVGLRSIQRLADAGSIEALEALCQLAIMSAKALRTLQRVRYMWEHPYPWQKGAGRPEVTDAEVSQMLKALEGDPTEEKGDENPEL
jgi:hypothetical protein